MKIKRYKKVHRNLLFYTNNFAFRKPYQILVDGTFCFAARQEQINIKEQIPKYLMSEVKLLTTQCVILETERIAKKAHTALTVLKQYGVHQCCHKSPITGAACLTAMVAPTNDRHYIIATQDRSLQDNLRKIPGVPLLFFHNKTPVLDTPSSVSYDLVHSKQKTTLTLSAFQLETLSDLKSHNGLCGDELEIVHFKKKKKRGPNPLSCQKKKKKLRNTSMDNKVDIITKGKIKKRKRMNIKPHVKELLKATCSKL